MADAAVPRRRAATHDSNRTTTTVAVGDSGKNSLALLLLFSDIIQKGATGINALAANASSALTQLQQAADSLTRKAAVSSLQKRQGIPEPPPGKTSDVVGAPSLDIGEAANSVLGATEALHTAIASIGQGQQQLLLEIHALSALIGGLQSHPERSELASQVGAPQILMRTPTGKQLDSGAQQGLAKTISMQIVTLGMIKTACMADGISSCSEGVRLLLRNVIRALETAISPGENISEPSANNANDTKELPISPGTPQQSQVVVSQASPGSAPFPPTPDASPDGIHVEERGECESGRVSTDTIKPAPNLSTDSSSFETDGKKPKRWHHRLLKRDQRH